MPVVNKVIAYFEDQFTAKIPDSTTLFSYKILKRCVQMNDVNLFSTSYELTT